MIKKYFKSEHLLPEEEISSSDAFNRDVTYEAYYNTDNKLSHVRVYSNHEFFLTIYFADRKSIIPSILADHRKRNEVSQVKIILPEYSQEDLKLQQSFFYTEKLEFDYSLNYFMDKYGHSIKEETLNERGEIQNTQRLHYTSQGELQYAFEYDQSGKLFNTFSFTDGGSIQFEDISDVPDKHKYLNA